jgi:hypothetical protein
MSCAHCYVPSPVITVSLSLSLHGLNSSAACVLLQLIIINQSITAS